MDADQLVLLKEGLRRDLEALERVEAMIAKEAALKKTDDRQIPLPMKPVLVQAEDEDDSGSLDATSLRGAIYKLISAEPFSRWTTQRVYAKLQADGYQFNSQKPLVSISQALKALVKQQKIRITKRGTGSAPNIYKGLQEGSSASEHALAG